MIISVHLCWSYDDIAFSIFVLDYEAQMNLTVISRVRGLSRCISEDLGNLL